MKVQTVEHLRFLVFNHGNGMKTVKNWATKSQEAETKDSKKDSLLANTSGA